MYTSITNLNGKQQNTIHHVSKRIKEAIQPLMIICYGLRSINTFSNSVFKDTYITRSNTLLLDILLIIKDEESLPDTSLLELAKRNGRLYAKVNILLFRMKHISICLQQKNRFFASILKRGILLYGNSSALDQIPNPLPSIRFTDRQEQTHLASLLKCAQTHFQEAKKLQKEEFTNPNEILRQLQAATKHFIQHAICACWGLDKEGSIAELLDFTLNLTDELKAIFPENTQEEKLLLDTLNQSLLESHHRFTPLLLTTLTHRIELLGNISQSLAQKKMSKMFPREEKQNTIQEEEA